MELSCVCCLHCLFFCLQRKWYNISFPPRVIYLLVVLIEWQICELVWAFQTGLCKHTIFIAYLYLIKTGFGLFCKLSQARTFKSSKIRKALLTWTRRVYDSALAHEGKAFFFFYSFSHARAHTHKHIHTDVILQRDAQILPELTSTKHSSK